MARTPLPAPGPSGAVPECLELVEVADYFSPDSETLAPSVVLEPDPATPAPGGPAPAPLEPQAEPPKTLHVLRPPTASGVLAQAGYAAVLLGLCALAARGDARPVLFVAGAAALYGSLLSLLIAKQFRLARARPSSRRGSPSSLRDADGCGWW